MCTRNVFDRLAPQLGVSGCYVTVGKNVVCSHVGAVSHYVLQIPLRHESNLVFRPNTAGPLSAVVTGSGCAVQLA